MYDRALTETKRTPRTGVAQSSSFATGAEQQLSFAQTADLPASAEARARPRRSAPREGGEARATPDRRVGSVVLLDGLQLDCGRRLRPITIAYEQYGEMNADRSNVVLACHALSGGAHAAGYDAATGKTGWWDGMIGPGRAFDTTRSTLSHFTVSVPFIPSAKWPGNEHRKV